MAEQSSHDVVVNQSPSDGELKNASSDVNDERLNTQVTSVENKEEGEDASGKKHEGESQSGSKVASGGEDHAKKQDEPSAAGTTASTDTTTPTPTDTTTLPSNDAPVSVAEQTTTTATETTTTDTGKTPVPAAGTTSTTTDSSAANNTTPTGASAITTTTTSSSSSITPNPTTDTSTTAAGTTASASASRNSSATRSDSTGTEKEKTATGTSASTVKKSAFKPVSFAKFSISKPAAVVAGAAGSGVAGVGGADKKGTFTTPSITSTSSPAAASSRPRLVAKTGSGLTGTLSRAGASGSQGTPRAVWNKNQVVAPQPTPSSLPASAAKHLTDEELQQRYGIHMTSRLPSQHPPASSSQSQPESGADGSKPAEHHSQWADEDDDEDDWTPETITWTDGTKHKITPLGEAKTIVKLTPTHGEEGDMKEEKVVLGSGASAAAAAAEKEKPTEKELLRETEKRTPTATGVISSPATTTVKPIIKSKLSPNTTVLKVGQSAAERAGQFAGSAGAGKGGDASANKSAASQPAKSPWAPLPPVEKVSPAALAAQAAQQVKEQHPHPSFSRFDHDRDRYGLHGHGGFYNDRDRDRGGSFYGDRHGSVPHFRERDFPHAGSGMRDPALEPFASPPPPPSQGPYHSHIHHGPPPREIAADDFNRTWRDHPASNAPRELFNSRSGRYEPVDPAVTAGPHHRRERGEKERRPTHLLQRLPGDEKVAGPADIERGRAASNVSAGPKGLTAELSGTAIDDRTRSISPNVAATPAAAPDATDAADAVAGEPAAGGEEQQLLPGEDPVAMQKRIMKEKIAEARRRRQEVEAREAAERQERIRQKLAAMGPPPVSKSQKEKTTDKEKEKEKEVWKRKEHGHAAGIAKSPEQGKVVAAATIDAAVKAGLQSPPKPPVIEPSGAPKQYGLMKVHAPEPLRRPSHGKEDMLERSELLQRQHLGQTQQATEHSPQWQQAAASTSTATTAVTSTPNVTAAVPAGTMSSPLAGQTVQVPAVAPSTTTVSPFSPWAAPSTKLATPGGGPSAVWGSPNAERALGNGTFDRNFAGFRREAPPGPTTTGASATTGNASVNPVTPLGVPTSMALDGLTSSPLSPETRNVEPLQPIGRPAGPPRPIGPPQGFVGNKQQYQRGHRALDHDMRNRPPQIAAWHNFHNVVAETEADENEKFQKDMVALREEEARHGGSVPVKFNQTWRKVEVGDEVGSRHVVGVTKTEHQHGKAVSQQQQEVANVPSSVVPAVPVTLPPTSPGSASAGLSPLHGFGNVVGLSPFSENAPRPLGSNATRESRFFPHGGNANLPEKRGHQSSQLSPPVPIVPLQLAVPLQISPSLAPAVPCPPTVGDYDRTPSPPPPVDFAFSHPVFASDLSRPLVHLPSPRPVVRLPPSSQATTASTHEGQYLSHGDVRHPLSQRQHGSPAGPHAATSSPRPAGEAHPSTWWQEKIDGLLGKKSAPASPAMSASVGGKNVHVVSPSTKEPYDVFNTPATAAVSLPYGAEGLMIAVSLPATLQVTSKNVEEEEEIFEDREAGSLPVVRVPDMAPPKAWEPAPTLPETRSRTKAMTNVEAVSKGAFTVAHLGKEGGNLPIVVKFAFMHDGKTVYLPRSGGFGSGRGRGSFRGRRGGKNRDSGAPAYERRNPRHSAGSGGPGSSPSPAGATSSAKSSFNVNHAQQPPTAPKAATTTATPPLAPKTATPKPAAKAITPTPAIPKPASPPSTQPMTWASRVARGV